MKRFLSLLAKIREQKAHLAGSAAYLIFGSLAHGAGAGMPWETPLNSFLNSLTGPVAKIAGVAWMLAGLILFAILKRLARTPALPAGEERSLDPRNPLNL